MIQLKLLNKNYQGFKNKFQEPLEMRKGCWNLTELVVVCGPMRCHVEVVLKCKTHVVHTPILLIFFVILGILKLKRLKLSILIFYFLA
jgi:hypothetical protein